MALKRIAKGVYSINGDTPERGAAPIVPVHPYFWYGPFDMYVPLRRVFRQNDYIQRFETLISDKDRPVVTLEQPWRINSTAYRYSRLGRSNKTFFIKFGRIDGPYLSELYWPDVTEFLKSFERPVSLVGGHYSQDRPQDFCLGQTALRLGEENVPFEILTNVTF